MPQAAHVWPNITQQMGANTGTQINLSSDTLKVLLIASGTITWGSTVEAYDTVSQLITGASLTEVSGGSYSRQALTSVTYTETGLVSTLTCANPSWASATFSATYAVFYDYTAGPTSDTNGLLLCYWDFGGTQTVASATFTLTISGSGLVTWTSS